MVDCYVSCNEEVLSLCRRSVSLGSGLPSLGRRRATIELSEGVLLPRCPPSVLPASNPGFMVFPYQLPALRHTQTPPPPPPPERMAAAPEEDSASLSRRRAGLPAKPGKALSACLHLERFTALTPGCT